MTRRILLLIAAALPAVALLPAASAAPPPSAATVMVKDSFYESKVVALTLAKGKATVTWKWDTMSVRPHNVQADNDSFNSHPECNTGGGFYGLDTSISGCGFTAATTFTQTFTKPGLYRYFCTVHGGTNGAGMAGTVLVKAPLVKKRR